jgi:hypothetical protein
MKKTSFTFRHKFIGTEIVADAMTNGNEVFRQQFF